MWQSCSSLSHAANRLHICPIYLILKYHTRCHRLSINTYITKKAVAQAISMVLKSRSFRDLTYLERILIIQFLQIKIKLLDFDLLDNVAQPSKPGQLPCFCQYPAQIGYYNLVKSHSYNLKWFSPMTGQ